MEPCWEFFHCVKSECSMFGRTDVKCWTVEGTLCNNLTMSLVRPAAGLDRKKDACERAHCIYLDAARSRGSL